MCDLCPTCQQGEFCCVKVNAVTGNTSVLCESSGAACNK
jgi:hypothetical protein